MTRFLAPCAYFLSGINEYADKHSTTLRDGSIGTLGGREFSCFDRNASFLACCQLFPLLIENILCNAKDL